MAESISFFPLRRKHRWTIVGFNSEKEVVFPESFVKVGNRPVLGSIGRCELSAVQYIEERQIDAYDGSKGVTSIVIRLYDWLGKLLERWDLIEAKIEPRDPLAYSDEMEWKISYKGGTYWRLRDENILS